MKKKTLLIIIAVLGVIFLFLGGYILFNNNKMIKQNKNTKHNKVYKKVDSTNNFNIDLIKAVNNNEDGNYLISPYSIELALAMLKEGANGTTYDEMEKVIPTRNIETFNVKDRISVANAIFIKESFKNAIKSSFTDSVNKKYNSELLYDKFTKPDLINEWVNIKTNGMIKKVVNEISPDFVLGISNALAIDVEWDNEFDCVKTREGKFTTSDGTKKVEMMHNSYKNAKYIKTDNEIGVILPYKSYKSDGTYVEESSNETTDLEFIAILPNEDVTEYIKKLDLNKLNSILDNNKTLLSNQELKLSMPRFEYDYQFDNFKEALINIGLEETMSASPDFTKMTDEYIYVSQAVHKTHISLNEKGTKAAAVTFFGMDNLGALDESEIIGIDLNKPFMYVIREKNTKEMLFFGVVKSPNEWKGSTCK